MNEYIDGSVSPAVHDLPIPHEVISSSLKHRAVIFMAIINVAVIFALGALITWHARLIGRGETSIEAHINISETKRYNEMGKMYINPYNFGRKKNWKLFLGLVKGRFVLMILYIFLKFYSISELMKLNFLFIENGGVMFYYLQHTNRTEMV